MRVSCVKNKGEDLTKATIDLGGYTLGTNFAGELKVNTVYTVYGISLWMSSLHYLLIGEDDNCPDWYPSELFEVIDKRLPFEWFFTRLKESEISNVKAIWGYEELVMDEDHYDDLVERKIDAFEVFLKRKKDIDEYHDLFPNK